MSLQGVNHLETLLLRLVAANGADALDERKKVMNYIRFTNVPLAKRQIRQIRDIRLLRQLMGVGVAGPLNRALNARLAELGG